MHATIVVLTFAGGLFLFLYGFFLTRKELGIHSDAILDDRHNQLDKKVIFIIIDALRYDFVISSPNETCSNNSPYNCFSTITKLLKEQPYNSAVFKFLADAPTVTAQRLKGLTVGCFPTFIDAGSNLNSSTITDDNILFQLRKKLEARRTYMEQNRTMIALGDDTWKSLFSGNIFDEMHMYDSFNTWDLETVDNGIMEHYWKYFPDLNINSSLSSDGRDWQFLVAHFLGVDHIGHTHHALHPLMSQRLQLMDSILAETILRLPDDTILFLFGDHGMTLEGEHGGASEGEINSALFVYSKEPFHSTKYSDPTALIWDDTEGYYRAPSNNLPKSIRQIDLVPTLAYLWNVPIPFSSLGNFIPELLFTSSFQSRERELLRVMRKNMLQILRFCVEYHGYRDGHSVVNSSNTTVGNDTTHLIDITEELQVVSLLNQLLKNLDRPVTSFSSDFLPKRLIEELKQTLELDQIVLNELMACEEDSSISPFCRNISDPDNTSKNISLLCRNYSKILASVQSIAREEWTEFKPLPMCCGMILMTLASLYLFYLFNIQIISRVWNILLYSSTNIGVLVAIAAVAFGLPWFYLMHSFSNSFITEEHTIVFVLLQTTTILPALVFLGFGLSHSGSKLPLKLLVNTVLVVVSQRLLWYSSQGNVSLTENTSFLTNISILLVCGLVFFFVYAYFIRINKFSLMLMTVSQALVVIYRILGVLQTSKSSFKEYLWYENMRLCIPLVVLVICSSIFAAVILGALLSIGWNPTRMFSGSFYGQNKTKQVIPMTQHSLGLCFLAILTLYTLYTPNIHQQCVILLTTACYIVTIKTFLEILAHFSSLNEIMNHIVVLLSIVVMIWIVSASKWLFFVTQHRCQFNNLQLQVAFVGRMQFEIWYGGIALAINTLGHDWLVWWLWNYMSSGSVITAAAAGTPDVSPGVILHSSMTKSMISRLYIWYRLSILCANVISAYALRRHLMLWAIFAPKLVFEVAMGMSILLFTCCTCI